MITIKKISELPDTEVTKLLITAVAVLTSISEADIEEEMWGGTVQPDDALKQIVELANKLYYFEEWESEEKSKERIEKINKIVN
jgi:DNA phosphorothioation-dependent restriction protein DptG